MFLWSHTTGANIHVNCDSLCGCV